jgi:hypothetical protein
MVDRNDCDPKEKSTVVSGNQKLSQDGGDLQSRDPSVALHISGDHSRAVTLSHIKLTQHLPQPLEASKSTSPLSFVARITFLGLNVLKTCIITPLQ